MKLLVRYPSRSGANFNSNPGMLEMRQATPASSSLIKPPTPLGADGNP